MYLPNPGKVFLWGTSSPSSGSDGFANKVAIPWSLRLWSLCQTEDLGWVPGSERSPGEGYACPLQYSCLEIPWIKKLGSLPSMGSQTVWHNWGTNTFTFFSSSFYATLSTLQWLSHLIFKMNLNIHLIFFHLIVWRT